MKPISWVGILLIVLGALVLAYQGINYTRQKKSLMWDRCISSPELTSEFIFLQYLEGSHWLEGSSCWS
jgi:hypothetical protein